MRNWLKIFFLLALPVYANAQMAGQYTIGGMNPQFATITDAIDTLSVQGLIGPVEFRIRPGLYSAFLTYPQLNYSYPVTFRSETGNPNDVVVTISNIYECRNLLFKRITIIPHVNNSYSYNYKGLEIMGSSYITIDSCIVRGTSNSLERIGITVASDWGFISITNTSFRNLDYGVVYSDNTYYQGSNTHYDGHLVQNCDFDSVTNAFLLSGQFGNSNADSLLITGCTIRNCQTGIQINGQADQVKGVKVYKNKIEAPSCVYIQSNTASGMYRMPVFINNMFSGSISTTYSSYAAFYNNSIYGQVNFGFYSHHFWFSNNAVQYMGLNSVIAIDDKNTYYADHNDFYSPNSSGGMFYISNNTPSALPDFATFITATGQDQNSLNVNPMYISPTDLHSYSPDLKFHGVSMPDVPDDIDGEIRNVIPDIGADEYHASPLPPHAFFNYDCGTFGNYSITLMDTSVRAISFFWDFGDNNTSVQESPVHTWSGAGPYFVTLIVSNSYGSDSLTDTVQFVQNVPSVTANSNQLTVSGGPYTMIQWNYNGSPINGANSATYSAPFNGVYSVSVWESGSTCPYESSPVIVGIKETDTSLKPVLFPNPVNDKLYISGLNSDDGLCISIQNVFGELINSTIINGPNQVSGICVLDTSYLMPGIYFVSIDNEINVLKFTKVAQ